jgi:hypothetical protein
MVAKTALLKEIKTKNIRNKPLRDLVNDLRKNINAGINPIRMTPPSAQMPQGDYSAGPGHTDHTDYSAHKDSSPGPAHGDYCD